MNEMMKRLVKEMHVPARRAHAFALRGMKLIRGSVLASHSHEYIAGDGRRLFRHSMADGSTLGEYSWTDSDEKARDWMIVPEELLYYSKH